MSTRHFANYYEDKILDLPSINHNNLIEYAQNILSNSIQNMPPIDKYQDGGLYVGFVGLGYAMLHLAKSDLLRDKKVQLLNQSKYYIEQDLRFYSQKKKIRDETRLSFLLGYMGTISLAIEVNYQLGLKEEAIGLTSTFFSLGEQFLPLEIHRFGSDELFVGKAGYLAAYFLIKQSCDEMLVNVPEKLIFGIMDSIVNSGQRYSQFNRCRSPLMYSYYGTEYLGAGHGLAGILFFLMKSTEYLNDRPAVVAMIQQSLDYMISVSPVDGNLPPATYDVKRPHNHDSQLTHWCHGAGGAVYTYARAYKLWNQDKYLQAAIRCGEIVWKYGLLKKGPGICHGIAGSGYVFLLLYRLTGKEIYLNRANCFCTFLNSEEFKCGAKIPDAPNSLFEGWAGTACFVADLANPNNGNFPFFDVFK